MKETAIGEGLRILLETTDMECFRLCDTGEGGSDAGVAFGLSGTDSIEITLDDDSFLLDERMQEHQRSVGRKGFLLSGGGKSTSLLDKQPMEDDLMLAVLCGGKAQGMGDNVKVGFLHCFSSGQALQSGADFAQTGLMQM